MSSQTSQDILNIAKAVAVIALAGFLCWATAYIALILRDLYKTAKEIRAWVKKIDEIIAILKDKIESSASYVILIGEGIKKMLEIMHDRKDKKSEDAESEK